MEAVTMARKRYSKRGGKMPVWAQTALIALGVAVAYSSDLFGIRSKAIEPVVAKVKTAS